MDTRQRPALKRLQKELVDLLNDPPPNCSAALANERCLYDWIATIKGPQGSVYEGGTFYLKMSFSSSYPFSPPKVAFQTRVYHCNISKQGAICLDILKERWTPTLTIGKLLLSISSLLTDCNPKDPLEPAIAKQYLVCRDAHDRTAREWTERHAKQSQQVVP